jgi:hypothetical protein
MRAASEAVPLASRNSKMESQAIEHGRNSSVSKILPVTTLRTIDLEGKKNSDRLFSRFCGEMRDFFQGNYAPEYVQVD